ncbi:hypothetical protein AU210_010983 [Fusarium oxysporum f. sp. radicis-cucumerinum]|uniref:Uncharacterized protein n=1 Tax=Fusarium oxysporum f. sp. radicis-cucumerinum TaxID=327505 RepID=A0A2H3GUF0_FUSOX|nr:hypothetical protein AU210_010983 [Fusarium oxysporum f. sp. radicis-cucumerinum]
MSMLPTIATALAEFVYDQDISFTLFTEPDEIPCFGCLTTIHRDARLLCVTEDSAKHIYLCYQDSRKKCGSRAVAEQISGPLKLPSDDPDVALTIQTQDSAANRELLSLQLLRSAGANFSLEETQARVAAATPLYARDDSKAVRLRKALRRLPNADKTPCGPDDGDLEDLPLEIDDTLIDQMNEARDSGSTAPVCPLPLLEWYPSTEDLPRPHRASARLSSLRQ